MTTHNRNPTNTPVKTTTRRSLCFALLVLCPSLLCAQSGTTDTVKSPDDKDLVDVANMQVYLQAAHADRSPPAFMSREFFQEIASSYTRGRNYLSEPIIIQNEDAKKVELIYRSIVKLADQAAQKKDPAEQRHLFENFLYESRVFLRDHYDPSYQLWVLRAVAALKLDKPATGIQAAQILSLMPPSQRAEPRIQRMLSVLGTHGWLPKDKPADAKPNPASPAPDKSGK